jgi:hypothetical protein
MGKEDWETLLTSVHFLKRKISTESTENTEVKRQSSAGTGI